MKNRFHGILSISLIAVAMFIGFYAVLPLNPVLIVVYGLVILTSPFIIVYFYCRKCPCESGNCGHLFPALIKKLFKKIESSKYTSADYFAVIIPLLLLIFIPQYGLFQNKVLFAIFWLLMLIGMLEIRFFVCTRCENKSCIANKKF